MADPGPRLRAELEQLVEQLHRIVKGFENEAMNGVICTPPDSESAGVEWDAESSRRWCERCRNRWSRLRALPTQFDALLRASASAPPETERLRIEVETLRTLLAAWQKRAYEAERTNPHGEPVDPVLLEPFIREMQDRVIPDIVRAVQERQRLAAETRDLPVGASASAVSPPPSSPSAEAPHSPTGRRDA